MLRGEADRVGQFVGLDWKLLPSVELWQEHVPSIEMLAHNLHISKHKDLSRVFDHAKPTSSNERE